MPAKLRVHRAKVLSFAATSAGALLSAVSPAAAAPAAYQGAVTANVPYLFYRQQESGITTGTTAPDVSGNSRTGTYNGTPTGGALGAGLVGSDTAVNYNVGTGADSQYLLASNARTFGSLLGHSSFEFVFKVDDPNAAARKQSLYGVFSNTTGGSLVAAEVTLNSRGNDALGTFADTTRLFIRDTAGAALGAHFVNEALYDGNYHHLVYTFDQTTLVSTPDPDGTGPLVESFTGGFAAYVDGVPQALTVQRVGGAAGLLPTTFGDFLFDPSFAARNVRGTGLAGNGIGQLADITLDETALYGSGSVIPTGTLTPAQVLANFGATGIPEPTSLALVGGALSLGLFGRHRRRA